MKILNDIFDYLNEENPVPGMVFKILDNEEESSLVWGHHSLKDSEPVKINTVYDLASITKLYTAYLILELNQKKHISIYDSCSKYLSNFKGSSIKIIDLLTHRANFNLSLKELRFSINFNNEVFNVQPPKTASRNIAYENITYLFLGKILEIIYKEDLSEILIDFFIRHELKETYLGKAGQKAFDAPPTEYIDGSMVKNITHDESSRLLGGIAGNAGIFSTAGDLIKFGSIWLGNTNIGQIAFHNYSDIGSLPQGLGWWNRVQGYDQVTPDLFTHTGYTGSMLAVNPKRNIVAALVTNRTFFGRENGKHRILWNIIADYLK